MTPLTLAAAPLRAPLHSASPQVHAIFREKEALAALEHPFICGLRCSFQTEHHLCLVLDFIECGNMYNDLMAGAYTLPRCVYYSAQIALALDHIHSFQLLYRDVRCAPSPPATGHALRLHAGAHSP